MLSLHLLVVLPWICTGWCCLVCPLNTDTMNLWNEEKNHGIRQHGTLMSDMTFSCHLIFEHSAAVQSQNYFGVYQFWHRSIFLFHLTLSHSSSVYKVCSPFFFGNGQCFHILWHSVIILVYFFDCWVGFAITIPIKWGAVKSMLLNRSSKYFCSTSSLHSRWRS